MYGLQKTGFFLILLIITQTIITSAKQYHYHHVYHGRHSNRDFGICRRDGDDMCPVKKKDSPREKRLVLAVLFAISVFATLANIGFDIYLKVKKCCGLYPDACKYERKFVALKDELKRRASEMNDHYTISKNILAYLKSTNNYNAEIWQNVKRIMVLTNEIVETLDTSIIVKYNNKSAELRREIRKHNETAKNMDILAVSTEFQSVFDSVEGTLLTIAPIVGLLGSAAISKSFTWYKTYKAAEALKSTGNVAALKNVKVAKVFGVKNVNTFIKSTATAQTRALTTATRFSKFLSFATGAMSVLTIGFEIYSAIMKVKACQKVRDNAVNSYNAIYPEKAKFKKSEDNLVAFRSNLTKSYNHVKSQIISDAFLGYVKQIHQMVASSDKTPPYLKKAGREIQNFQDQIKAASKIKTTKLQKLLYNALTNVTYTWQCYGNKIKTVSYAYKKCLVGEASMELIWKNAIKNFETNNYECTTATGQSYTTYRATKTYVETRMQKEGYQKDCVLNNRDLFRLACTYYVQGFTDVQNGGKTGLTVTQVEYFKKICPPATVTPKVSNLICTFKSFLSLEDTKKHYSKYDQGQVTTTYNSCPPPVLTGNIKRLICAYKNRDGKDLNAVLTKYSQYSRADVTSTYNSCTTPVVTRAMRKFICNEKKYGGLLKDILESYPNHRISDLTNTFNAC